MPRKLLKFLIVFDNTSLLYFPGQFLSGKVLMELQDDTPVLGLHFHVIGEGVVRVGSGRHERLFDKENYIDFRMRLLGEPGHTPSLLSPGIHSFPFKLGLPMGLPSTFLGTHGWVQYYCKAALREPNGLTHKNQQVFIVMNPIDLNLEPPVLSQELECSVEHRLGVGCVGGGALACRVALDRGAYVPGESIALSAHLVNNSRTAIKCTRAALTETIEYWAHGKVAAREVRELAALRRGKTRAGGSERWRELLYVPPLPPTNLRGCHLIALHYDVFVRELLYVPPLPPTNLRGCHLIALHYDVFVSRTTTLSHNTRGARAAVRAAAAAHQPARLPPHRPALRRVLHYRAEESREGGEIATADRAGHVPVPRGGRGARAERAAAHALPHHAARVPRLAARQAALTAIPHTTTLHSHTQTRS